MVKKENSHPGFNSIKILAKPKRSQVTIFIIVAIIIVAAALIYFLYIQPNYVAPGGGKLDFESCVEDAVEEEVETLGKQAGFANPEFFYLYQDEKIGYLCYTNLYHKPCIMQKPFLKQHFEEQLRMAASEEVKRCYESSINELKAQGYDVVSGVPDFEIALNPGGIVGRIDAPTSVTKQTTKAYKTFIVEMNSELYDMLMIATSLLQYEAKYGDSSIDSLMIFYPSIVIDKIKRDDGTTVYIIQDKQLKTKFQFASRSYPWPAGYGVSEGGRID